jgi:hypothetical protein
MKRSDPMMGGEVVYKTVEINKAVPETIFKPDATTKGSEGSGKTKQ